MKKIIIFLVILGSSLMNAQVTIVDELLIPEIWDEPIVKAIGSENRIIKHDNISMYSIKNANECIEHISIDVIKHWLIPQFRLALEFNEENKAMFNVKYPYTVLRVNERIDMVILYDSDNAIIMTIKQAKEFLNKLELLIP